MGWTTPRTWAIGEIVTASMMNTHVRDNLDYLKGNAGTIAFAAGATFAGAVGVTGSGGTLLGVTATTTSPTINITSPNIASQDGILQFTNTGQRVGQIIMDRANDKFRIATSTGAQPAISIDASGRVGIRETITPQGTIHAYGTVGGFMFYEATATYSAAVTIIPNGAGDVLYRLTMFGAARCSSGSVSAGNFGTGTTPSNNVNIASLNAGADVLNLAIAADGSVTITRTAGTSTWHVALMMTWL